MKICLLSDGVHAQGFTSDLLITNQLLYLLSQKGLTSFIVEKIYFAISN